MRVQFVERLGAPERMVAEVELHFSGEDGALDGLKLVGFVIWADPEGDPYVTFPARAFGAGHERKYFDYLRPADGTPFPVRRFKTWILAQYRDASKAA